MLWTWLRRIWVILAFLCFAAALTIPIVACVQDGWLGLIAGVYLGLFPGAAGFTMVVIAIWVGAWQRARKPPAPEPAPRVRVPEARVVSR
jgi:hypothetical protein